MSLGHPAELLASSKFLDVRQSVFSVECTWMSIPGPSVHVPAHSPKDGPKSCMNHKPKYQKRKENNKDPPQNPQKQTKECEKGMHREEGRSTVLEKERSCGRK